uniref:Uncharacterized protein n=1 Tax=Cucumis melo TaxID=3656 RepID=Q5DMV5_CUCME|nr:hypothetical protein [Cucumis melo]
MILGQMLFLLKISFSRLFRLSLNPNGAIKEFWDSSTASWALNFRELLKDEEVDEFQAIIGLISEG